ncbi:uncharacterized protein LOC125771235 [Anopheles funestus]|uniref:uncharacterized protein LOC125771235 n=1 Tax=Anopheles funestus TaxID=62324 RepID=UPI0020C69EDC|nr:uncharacterized protein LOC125771235 [Anopheles funestus]
MENNLVKSIYEAITIGDETMLGNCIKQATIDTVLEFRRSYGESPLHLCVKIGGVSHLGVVRCLLASGLFDSTTVDSEGQTVLQCALAEGGDSELVDALIKVEIDGLDDATACYKMLRHDSLQIFRTFLNIKKLKEEEEFQHIASALIQLNVKNVVLSEDLRHFILWKLSDYGFRKLSGNWSGTKDPNEWKNHIDVISECWSVIKLQYNTRLYADVDDQFLHRLQTVHNHLYFLKHKQFLAHLPMQEAIFCVAIFLSIYRNPEQFQEYRLMINKCLVIEFVRMISEQLAIVKTYLERTETELLSIVRTIEMSGTADKNKLIKDLLMKMESSNLPNKAHVIQQLKGRSEMDSTASKDSLIKDMLDKVKRIDKPWTEEMTGKVKALDKTYREQLIEQIGKRLRHVSHPQNVVNRLMGDWKKGKVTETIVADIVSGESFNLAHLMRGKDRRIKRKLLKCYSKTKQYYSLRKTLFYCGNIVPNAKERTQSTYVETACMKRTVQVFGEAFKNTTNSANMPGKAADALGTMLTELFLVMNKSFREVFSHSISLKKQLLQESFDSQFCDGLRWNFDIVRMTFQILYVVAVMVVKHSFYGYMRQCNTFRELRSLVLYVDDMEALEKSYLTCYNQVTQYFDKVKSTCEELEKESDNKIPEFENLHMHMRVKQKLVKNFHECLLQNKVFTYSDIRRACFSSDDLAAVRRLLDWKLNMKWTSDFFQEVRTFWKSHYFVSMESIEFKNQHLLKYDPALITNLMRVGSLQMDCVEEFEYIEHTRQFTQDIEILDKIDEKALQNLNERLKYYYNDIFIIDRKWKVLETFCKERKLSWNKELSRELIKRDLDHLQQLYDNSRNQLLGILKTYRLDTVDGLVTRLHELPTHILSAIEYIQLELCEMLKAVNYFGDSFHYLMSRIPMIQGKNYRNLLAHDALSYNLLTDSSMEKIVINAFVFSNTELKLFGNTGANKAHINVPTLSHTNHWVDLQKQLLEAFKREDVQGMHMIGQEGGEVKARFCCTRNESYLASAFFQLPELITPSNTDVSIVEYLNQYFPEFLERFNDPRYDSTSNRGNCLIWKWIFDWKDVKDLIQNLNLFILPERIIHNDQDPVVLKELIVHGNTSGVREIIPYLSVNSYVSDVSHALYKALLYCVRSVADLLIQRLGIPRPGLLFLAILLHWNDFFTTMMAKADIEEDTHIYLLISAVMSRNYTATVYLLENEAFTHVIPDVFQECCEISARMGDQSILQYFIELCPTTLIANNSLASSLHQAALSQQWHCVQLLLERDVPVDTIYDTYPRQKQCTLLLLVKYGRYRLLRRIKSIKNELFVTIAKHPFTVAVQNRMTSDKMIRSLRALGFDWLDSSKTLQAAIREKNKNVFETIQKLVNECCAENPSSDLDHFRHALMVLQRWKMISFVEESKSYGSSSLFSAIQAQDKDMVQELLSWAREMRTIEELGILGSIVFERETVFTCFGKRNNVSKMWNTRDSCEDMITRMETCAMLGEMIWQQITLNAQSSTPVTFYVLTTEDELIELPNSTFALRDKVSLEENLKDFLTFVNVALSNFTIFFAKFSTTDGTTRYFWQIEQISCMYDILPPSQKGVDLTDVVNYKNLNGETALHVCVLKNSLEIVKLLVENGANPLLEDKTGKSPITISLVHTLDYTLARYLLDECVRRDLRNEKGCSVMEVCNPISGDRLIHNAIAAGRQDIVQRLLELRVDVSVVNGAGITPVHYAAANNVYNKCRIVKMIIEFENQCEASSIDTFGHDDDTLIQFAARRNSLQLMQLVLQYKPNLTLCRNGTTALFMAIVLKHIECAKCLVKHAIENNIHGITLAGDDDLVLLSLICNDYDLSKMLLEYELGHTLEQVDERDLPRIKSILEGSVPKMKTIAAKVALQNKSEQLVMPDISVFRAVQILHLTESYKFLMMLMILAIRISSPVIYSYVLDEVQVNRVMVIN